MTRAVHQYFATFEPGAIGSHALQVQACLRDAGYESEIFAEFDKGGFEGKSFQHSDYGKKIKAYSDDILMYHMAIGSNVADWLNDVPKQRLIVAHHNITPFEYYEPWDPTVTYGMTWGRQQLEKLAKRATLGMAMSQYNRRELEALRYRSTVVSPLLIDFDQFDLSIDEAVRDRLMQRKAGGGKDWLFVGWIAPHKCQHDIIRAFALHRKVYDPNAHLYLVGRSGLEPYFAACQQLVSELGLEDAVTFTGRVTDGELGAHYATADVLVSMSEHEGVGIPLLEAMHHGVPIVAYSAAAVPETIADAGLVLGTKKPAVVSAAVARVLEDQPLAAELRTRGRQRLDDFSLTHARATLLESISALDQ